MEVCQRKVCIDSYRNVRFEVLKAVSIKITVFFWNALKLETASFFEMLFPICQAEVYLYAIKACAVESLGRDYRNRDTYTLPDNEAAINHLIIIRFTQNWSGTHFSSRETG
jgi:hypothetical protein